MFILGGISLVVLAVAYAVMVVAAVAAISYLIAYIIAKYTWKYEDSVATRKDITKIIGTTITVCVLLGFLL